MRSATISTVAHGARPLLRRVPTIALCYQKGEFMAQVLIRNIDDDAIERLKARAARNKTSLERELRAIITEASQGDRPEARRRAAEMRRSLTGRRHSDSTKLIRADRDR